MSRDGCSDNCFRIRPCPFNSSRFLPAFRRSFGQEHGRGGLLAHRLGVSACTVEKHDAALPGCRRRAHTCTGRDFAALCLSPVLRTTRTALTISLAASFRLAGSTSRHGSHPSDNNFNALLCLPPKLVSLDFSSYGQSRLSPDSGPGHDGNLRRLPRARRHLRALPDARDPKQHHLLRHAFPQQNRSRSGARWLRLPHPR